MYAKLFKSLFEGSMRGQSDVILVWINLLAHVDQGGFVDRHFRVIADETGLPMERVQSAITILESPDPDSRSSELEGRRLERIDEHRDWGWRVVTHAKYQAIRNAEERREQIRQAQETFREKQRLTNADSNQPSSIVINRNQPSSIVSRVIPLDVDVDVDVRTKKTPLAVSCEKSTAQPPTPKPPKIEFGVQGFENITDRDREMWHKAYPAIDLDTEIAKMEAWIVANPKNRKSNWHKFIVNWLSRSQDKAPGTKKITWKDVVTREKELARKKREDNKPIPALAPVIKEIKAGLAVPYDKKAEDCTNPKKAECQSPYCKATCRFRGITPERKEITP